MYTIRRSLCYPKSTLQQRTQAYSIDHTRNDEIIRSYLFLAYKNTKAKKKKNIRQCKLIAQILSVPLKTPAYS